MCEIAYDCFYSKCTLNYFSAVKCFNYFGKIAKMPLSAPKDFGAIAKKALGTPKGSYLVSFGAIDKKMLSAPKGSSLPSFGAIAKKVLSAPKDFGAIGTTRLTAEGIF